MYKSRKCPAERNNTQAETNQLKSKKINVPKSARPVRKKRKYKIYSKGNALDKSLT